jgi:MarR family transcriptional regulator, lower aerobic nicotinate degradation pathway regulator
MSRVPKLTDHLGYWLRQLSNHVSHSFSRRLAAREVTVAEWVFLRALHGREPIAPSQLAKEMGFTRGAITKLADRLIARGFVRREASAEDGRAQTLRLDRKGANLVPELASLADQNETECFAHLTASDRKTLRRILENSVDRLGVTAMPVD